MKQALRFALSNGLTEEESLVLPVILRRKQPVLATLWLWGGGGDKNIKGKDTKDNVKS
jgi:hypothetical protein